MEKINWESTVNSDRDLRSYVFCSVCFSFSRIVLKQNTNKVFGVNRL